MQADTEVGQEEKTRQSTYLSEEFVRNVNAY